jgi:NADPH-dependent glutamate synthase beta subunit-like oxidoreductase
VGAHKDQKLNITGEKNPSVIPGMVFLRKVNLSQKAKVGERVAVIGGGNVAIDAARTALRMGAKKVTLIYRRTRNEMPAYKEEIEEADKEGVKFQFLAAPTKIIYRDGKFTSLRCIRMELGEPDASGRRHPIPIKGSNFIVEADTIIPAIGQTPDLAFLKGMEIEATPEGTIKVDTVTLKTSKKGVFAAGDVISGPASVIEAVAMGRKAASSIDKYLGGSGDIDETLVDVEEPSPWLGAEYGFADLSRIQMACSSIVQRMTSARNGGFVEVKLGFSEDMAVKEAKRCLKCHLRFQVQRVATLQLNSPIK